MNQKLDFSPIPRTSNEDASKFTSLCKLTTSFALLGITETGLQKSIMDATAPFRFFLKESNVHDYSSQKQGPENKKLIKSFFVESERLIETKSSLYRPNTKEGDPRVWFYGLNRYCSAGDLLLVFENEGTLYISNISKSANWHSYLNQGLLYQLLSSKRQKEESVKEELLGLLKGIHDKGWIMATTHGDTAVGDTLEHELGISRNSSKKPDYKGIELKASRITKNGKKKATTRVTLFTKTPDKGLSYREIVEKYGKLQIPRGKSDPRLQLYETFRRSRINAYSLFLCPNENDSDLEIRYSNDGGVGRDNSRYVSSWSFDNLSKALTEKHSETFFVKAKAKTVNGIEYFLFEKVIYTHKPNPMAIFPLINTDDLTVDLAAHIIDGHYRDHGILFKMMPEKIGMLLGPSEEFDL